MQSTTPTGRSVMQAKGNIAARAGRWSAQHKKTAIFGWLAVVVIALVLGTAAGMQKVDESSGPGEAGEGSAAIERAFPSDETEEQVLVQKKDSNVTDAQFKSAIDETVHKLEQTEDNVAAPLATVASVQRSHPGLRVEEFGDASVGKALTETEEKDFAKAETMSLPITLLILVVAFGAIVAAGIPVILALS